MKSLTDMGKRIQLVKMVCLTVVPILGLWGFSVFTLQDTMHQKTENEKVQDIISSLVLERYCQIVSIVHVCLGVVLLTF